MTEYIERAAVEEMLENAQLISDGEYCGYCTEDVNLGSIPAADVAPVRHGKWIVTKEFNDVLDMDVEKYTCSACGEYRLTASGLSQATNYCPNCGAKMDADE